MFVELGHFRFGKKVLKENATPVPNSKHSPSVTDSDHTYSQLSRSVDAGFATLFMTVTMILICWLPFLILFFFCCDDDESSVDMSKKSRSRVTPVSNGVKLSHWTY